MCDIDCDDSHRISNSHECEKCVNSNTRVLNQVFNDNIPFQVTPFLDYTDESFKSKFNDKKYYISLAYNSYTAMV